VLKLPLKLNLYDNEVFEENTIGKYKTALKYLREINSKMQVYLYDWFYLNDACVSVIFIVE
jgi:hypothetical protein